MNIKGKVKVSWCCANASTEGRER